MSKISEANSFSICDKNFDAIFKSIAKKSFSLNSHFKLTQKTELNNLKVSVNGVIVTDSNYQFNSLENSLQFKEASIPNFDSKISIDYKPVCIKP